MLSNFFVSLQAKEKTRMTTKDIKNELIRDGSHCVYKL